MDNLGCFFSIICISYQASLQWLTPPIRERTREKITLMIFSTASKPLVYVTKMPLFPSTLRFPFLQSTWGRRKFYKWKEAEQGKITF